MRDRLRRGIALIALALRGLGARKLRAVPDRARDPARRRDGRRHLHAEGVGRQGLRRHLRRGQRRDRRHRAAEARSTAASTCPSRARRCRESLVEQGRAPSTASRRPSGGDRRLDLDHDPRRERRPDRPLRRRPAADRRRASLPEPFNPFTWIEGSRPDDRRRGRDRLDHRRRGGLRGRPDRSRSAAGRGAKEYTLCGIGRFGSGVPLGGASLAVFTAARGAARSPARRASSTTIDVEAADGVTPGGARRRGSARCCRDDAEAKTGAEDAAERVRRHQGRLRLPDDGAARLRRDLGLRRRLPDLQHVLDHGRPADPRVRDAADARRVVAAGPRDRRRRGARARPARLDRSASSPASASSSWSPALFKAIGLRAAAVGHRDRPGRGDHRADGRRHGRDPRLGDRPGAARDPGHPARGAPRGRGRRRTPADAARRIWIARGAGRWSGSLALAGGLFATASFGSALPLLGLGLVLLFVGVAMLAGTLIVARSPRSSAGRSSGCAA